MSVVADAKECALCHRIGYRAFVPYGSEGWCCFRDDLCRKRRASHSEGGDQP